MEESNEVAVSESEAGGSPAGGDRRTLGRLGALFAAFAAVCLLAGASRMVPGAWELRPMGDVIRIREALSMFVFAPAICALFWMFCRALGDGRVHAATDALMVLSVYFIACGMGMHDPANRMGEVYRHAGDMAPEVRRSLAYVDDRLGHWVFWAGFTLGTWVLGLRQVCAPLRGPMAWPWRLLFGAVAGALLWVMLTNLWDEYPKTRVDLCVIALAALVPLVAHAVLARRVGVWRLPMLFVIYTAYFGSIAGTMLCWLVRYGHV